MTSLESIACGIVFVTPFIAANVYEYKRCKARLRRNPNTSKKELASGMSGIEPMVWTLGIIAYEYAWYQHKHKPNRPNTIDEYQ